MSILAACALMLVSASISGCASSKETQTTYADEKGEDTTVYPDFSKPLMSAMPQMSDAEASKQEAQLEGLAAQRKSGAISQAEYDKRVAELRKLHQQTTTDK